MKKFSIALSIIALSTMSANAATSYLGQGLTLAQLIYNSASGDTIIGQNGGTFTTGFSTSASTQINKGINLVGQISATGQKATLDFSDAISGMTFTGAGLTSSISNFRVINKTTSNPNARVITTSQANFNISNSEFYNTGGIYLGSGVLNVSATQFNNNGQQYRGGAIEALGDVNITGIGNSFISNVANGHGGAIYSENVTVNISASGTIFASNSSGTRAGAIYNNNGFLNLGTGTIFTRNSSPIGGAIYSERRAGQPGDIGATGDTTTIGANSMFGQEADTTSGNHATAGGGGAIYNAGGSQITINNGVGFHHNTSTSSGGAIVSTASSNLIIKDNVVFNHNSTTGMGGGIYMSTSDLTIGNGAKFIDNSATTNGGAIYSNSGTVTIGNNAVFGTTGHGNTAGANGGAIYSTGTLSIGTNANFTANSAVTNGGAIYATAGTTIGGLATFSGNSATDGGAIFMDSGATLNMQNASFLNNSSGDEGGAIYGDGSITFNDAAGKTSFTGNTSGRVGGAIYLTDDGVLNIDGNADFINNSSSSGGGGGAIYNAGGRINFTNGNAVPIIFNGNKTASGASAAGGAIYNNGGSLQLAGAMQFVNNSATLGGAIYSFAGNVTGYLDMAGGLNFTGNTATGTGGGAVYNSGSGNTLTLNTVMGDVIFLNNKATTGWGGALANGATAVGTITMGGSYKMTFSGNTAATTGGGIYNAGTLTIGGSSDFLTNTAGTRGGAIWNTSNLALETGVSGVMKFDGNKANDSGGAIYSAGGVLNFDNTDGGTFIFSNNTATTGNGGAIYIAGTNTTTALTGNTTFTGNKAGVSGGAIYVNTGNALNISNTHGTPVSFSSNSASSSGGAITNSGTMSISGGTTFSGNSATTYGGAVYNNGIMSLYTSNGKNIDFTSNTAQQGGDIFNNSTLSITGLAGTEINLNSTNSIYNNALASINKTGANTLNIAGSAMGTGGFRQTAGTTIANNGFFTGGAAKTYVANSSLSVKYNSFNYGLTLGTGGSLKHMANSSYNNNISSSNLVFEAGANNITALFDTSLTGFFGYYNLVNKIENGGTGNSLTINSANVTFGSNDYTGTTHYALTNDRVSLGTPDNTLRTITFDYLSASDTILSFDLYAMPTGGVETFTSDKIVVNNPDAGNPAVFKLGAIRMIENADNGKTSDSISNVLTGATFEAGGKASIATTAYEYLVTVDTPRTGLELTVNGPSGYNSLNKMNMDVDNATSRGFNFSFFKGPQTYNIDESLGIMADGDFTVTGYSEDATESVISGYLREITFDAGTTRTWGDVTTNQGYMFNISGTEKVDFVMSNLTVSDTLSVRGAALFMDNVNATANISNVIFENNNTTTSEGGAIYIDYGTLTLANSRFINNHAGGSGGAIYTRTAMQAAGDMYFEGNSGDVGGAVYAHDDLTFFGDVTFIDNKSTDWGGAIGIYDTELVFNGDATFTNNVADKQGGAIGTAGDNAHITFNMDADTVIDFTGNMAAGVANDINLRYSNSDITFAGSGGVATLNGGISSDDADTSINVGGNVTVNFGADSVNDAFLGDFHGTGGTTNVYSDNWIDGDNIITGGTLHLWESVNTHGVEIATGGILDIRAFVTDPLMPAIASASNQYNTVKMENFTGSGGGIWLNTNGSIAGTDKIEITQSATGDAVLNFTVIGSGPIDRQIEVIDLNGATSDATFALANNAKTVDIGAWSYRLENFVNDGWYLNAQDLNSTAQSVMGIPGLHLSMVKTGMNELRKRLGALRNNNNNDELVGAWVRGYGKNLHIHELVHAKMNLGGIEGGIDFMKNALNGKIYFGIMGGMMDSEDVRFKTSVGGAGGWSRTPSVGAYATWIHKSNSSHKWFVDLTARHFWAHTHVEKDDKTNGYDVTRNFWAFSAETGKLFYGRAPEWLNIGTLQHSHVSIEPKLELRYKQGSAMNFETFAGDLGHVDTTKSFSAHLNFQMNFLPNGTQSKWKPYIELGVYNEWLGDTEMEFANVKLCTSETKGLGINAVLGTSAELSDKTYLYGGYTFDIGKAYTGHQLNIGIRTKF